MYKLSALHRKDERYTEAALTLLLHGNTLKVRGPGGGTGTFSICAGHFITCLVVVVVVVVVVGSLVTAIYLCVASFATLAVSPQCLSHVLHCLHCLMTVVLEQILLLLISCVSAFGL